MSEIPPVRSSRIPQLALPLLFLAVTSGCGRSSFKIGIDSENDPSAASSTGSLPEGGTENHFPPNDKPSENSSGESGEIGETDTTGEMGSNTTGTDSEKEKVCRHDITWLNDCTQCIMLAAEARGCCELVVKCFENQDEVENGDEPGDGCLNVLECLKSDFQKVCLSSNSAAENLVNDCGDNSLLIACEVECK